MLETELAAGLSSLATLDQVQLLGHEPLQQLFRAIAAKFDQYDRLLVPGKAPTAAGTGGSSSSGLVVLERQQYEALEHRLETLENALVQSRVQAIASSPLAQMAADKRHNLRLEDHVIPLIKLDSQIKGCRTGVEANAAGVEEVRESVAQVAEALHAELQRELARMATKEELSAVEARVDAVDTRVTQNEAAVTQINQRIVNLESQIAALATRAANLEDGMLEVQREARQLRDTVDTVTERVGSIERQMQGLQTLSEKLAELEDLVNDAATKTDLEQLRHDLTHTMTQRLDGMQRQFNTLENKLEEHDSEVQEIRQGLDKANFNIQRLGAMQNSLQQAMASNVAARPASGHAGPTNASSRAASAATAGASTHGGSMGGMASNSVSGGTSVGFAMGGSNLGGGSLGGGSLGGGGGGGLGGGGFFGDDIYKTLDVMQREIVALKEAVSLVSEDSAAATEEAISVLQARVEELQTAKADRSAVERALQVKADRDAVARDTERNLRAVDEALTVMNAGTQGVQQLLDQQGEMVTALTTRLEDKLDRRELESLKAKLAAVSQGSHKSPEEIRQQQEAIYGQYGISPEDAAGMARQMDPYRCISCNHPLQPRGQDSAPTLPLMPPTGDRKTPYVAARKGGTRPKSGSVGSSSQGHPSNLRSAGGKASTMARVRSATRRRSEQIEVPVEASRTATAVIGDDGRVYHGIMPGGGAQILPRPTSERPSTALRRSNSNQDGGSNNNATEKLGSSPREASLQLPP